MQLKLIELTDINEVLKTYDIYKDCMFEPTEEKFNKKVDVFLADDRIKVFACICTDEIKGVIIVSFVEEHKAEIIGIAVELLVRGLGIGSYMIDALIDAYGLNYIYAETDNDAVGFYRKKGFETNETVECFGNQRVVRYKCELSK